MAPDHIIDWYEKKVREPVNADDVPTPVGQVLVIPNRCKECNYCVTFCPEDVLVFSEQFNDKGYHYPTVNEDKTCVLCGFCQEICPDFAIFTQPMEEA
ncbi:MAG: 4Fe-4S dicluster domain-containing protein [Candidatus Heimdallarchaeota archaeon]|nr:4Fe-4S dicluster domain-containing protein [Candidatus Heimdallarchaeota archaeon]